MSVQRESRCGGNRSGNRFQRVLHLTPTSNQGLVAIRALGDSSSQIPEVQTLFGLGILHLLFQTNFSSFPILFALQEAGLCGLAL